MSAARKTAPPSTTDQHVGQRLRQRRTHLGLTQEKLGEELGITFQQIQKYEHGANRISASRLFELAQILEVPVSYFYSGLEETLPPAPAGNLHEPTKDRADIGKPQTDSAQDLAELVALFTRLKNPKLRQQILDIVRTLAESSDQTP